MNGRLYFLFIVTFFSPLEAAKNQKRNEACITPNSKNGKCVPFNQCPIVSYALSSRKIPFLDFAKNSVCGHDEDTLVCCENPDPVTSADLLLNTLRDNTVCGEVKEQTRIYGDKLVQMGEFPWMAGIEYKEKDTNKNRGLYCGGSLISNEFVLTAAQCFDIKGLEAVAVRLGELDVTKNPDCRKLVAIQFCADPVEIIKIKETTPHPLYDRRTGYNDIGLIRLESKIQYSDYIKPICLSFSELPPPTIGEGVITAGWGATVNGTNSAELLKVELRVVSKDICVSKVQRPTRRVGLHHLCAGAEKDRDTCSGDAGVPLMRLYTDQQDQLMNWYQDGISSFGVGCGREGFPSVYVKVSSYFDWIANVIAQSRHS